MKTYAVGIMVKNRWELTKQTLDSLFHSDQDKNTYDLFIIDNGSDAPNVRNLKDYAKYCGLPIKNIISIPETTLSEAWNLFLALARNYEYRVKMDNDVILKETLPVITPKKPTGAPNPLDYGTNPGSIPTGPPVMGAGVPQIAMNRRRLTKKLQSHSRFLDHMTEFSKNNQVDVVSLLPVSPTQTFVSMFNAAIRKTWTGLPFLCGGCVMISRPCFEKIGYFHEKLPVRLDIEYSQRAIRNGLNIGYHPYYFITHIGANSHTETNTQRKSKNQDAIAVEQSSPIETYANSKWEKVVYDIENACIKDTILHLV